MIPLVLELLNQIIARSDRGERLAVCTLVRTSGSTPQKPGAIMLVLANGITQGTIGGGCVEAEVRTRALRLICAPSDRLLRFKLDHDLGWDDGLVCGGVMDVAVQVIGTPDQAAPFREARDRLAEGNAADLHLAVRDDKETLVRFVVPFRPAPMLIIAGAGHVGASLSAIAAHLDFQVIVVDDRADLACETRFPQAKILIGSVEAELGKLSLGKQSYIVIVTRGHRRDALALASVVRSPAAYIGLIGSRRKIITIFRELREQGVPTEQLAKVHAPIGLAIGAVTPQEIAISIAAELIAVRRLATGGVATMRLKPEQVERL